MINHVIDPTYFYDAIEEFAFDYTLFVKTDSNVDEYGKVVGTYSQQAIRGSLQSDGARIQRSKSGNTTTKGYRFYCESLYRINIGDIIEYKTNFYIVTSVQDYDEYGVRSCTCDMITLTDYRDFADYIKFIRGDKLV